MPASTAETHAYIAVGAHVQAVANIQSSSQPGDLLVSAQDLNRGYIDVLEPTQLLVNSNSAEGIALDLTPMNPMLSAMVVQGLSGEQRLGADGGTLIQRWERPNRFAGRSMRLSLRFRLVLAPGLAPGRYPWPLHVAIRPL